MVELQIQRHTSSMVKQLTREKNCKAPIISKLVFAAVPQILTRRLFANHVSSAASPFLPSFHNFPAKLHNNLPELNGQAEPLTAHFDHRSQFRCQENAYIKAKPVLAVYGSPCDYRLARNDFHNCGFAASAGIQLKGSNKTISEQKVSATFQWQGQQKTYLSGRFPTVPPCTDLIDSMSWVEGFCHRSIRKGLSKSIST